MDASFSAWRSLTTLGEVLPMCHMGKHKGTIRPHLGEVHAKNDHIAVGVAGCDETYCPDSFCTLVQPRALGTLFSGSWFRSPFFSRFPPFFSCDFSIFSFGSTYFLKPWDFDGFHFRFEVPPVGFLQTWQLQDLSMLVWGNKLESDYQCGGPGWTRKETHQELHGICCIFTVPRIPRPPILHRKM